MGIQVREATWDGLTHRPIVERSFISFKWGEKDIEDFDLIATLSGDRMNKNLYSSFSDTTTNYTGVDGQEYWLSTLQPLTLDFNLSTDGMTERQIEEFKNYFRPERIEYLVLAEHPNRRALARVASAPKMNMLPFDEKVDFFGAPVRTTLYKGDISLSLILDKPFWYAIDGSLSDLSTEEKRKVSIEDGIPLADAFDSTVKIFKANDSSTINLDSDTTAYVYNCGSAAAKPIISFSLIPQFSEDNYIIYPFNYESHQTEQYSNTITIGDKDFFFTLPSILYSYNKMLQIIDNNLNEDLIRFRELIIENIPHHLLRKEIVAYLSALIESGSTEVVSDIKDDLITAISALITNVTFSFSFNSTNGDSFVTYSFNGENIEERCGNMVQSRYLNIEGGNYFTIENGEMKIGAEQCSRITTDATLTDFNILFEYTYY